IYLPRRRCEREGLRYAPRYAGDPHQLRRRRATARPVLRRAQHRNRFQGQYLYNRNLSRPACATVLVQRSGVRDETGSGNDLAEEVAMGGGAELNSLIAEIGNSGVSALPKALIAWK